MHLLSVYSLSPSAGGAALGMLLHRHSQPVFRRELLFRPQVLIFLFSDAASVAYKSAVRSVRVTEMISKRLEQFFPIIQPLQIPLSVVFYTKQTHPAHLIHQQRISYGLLHHALLFLSHFFA